MTATRNTDGSIIAKKTYCSHYNFSTDRTLFDSISAFRNRYYTNTITVTEKDSIYNRQSVSDVKCNETMQYDTSGYGCSCPHL
jgi:hypothetical protein